MALIALGALLAWLACFLVVSMAFIAARNSTGRVEAHRWLVETPRGIEPGVHIDAESPAEAVDLLVKLRT